MKQFITLQKLQPGDKVAILSPSSGLPGLFPWVQDLGLERIKSEFGLVPIEYPTTRVMGSSLEDRARDVMDAFADPSVKGIITSIGGSDQIKLLKYLDREVLAANPKPFFGFSDNTHVHNLLWSLGIPSYYGGAVMTQFAMQGGMHEMTVDSLRLALFTHDNYEIIGSTTYNDEGLSWAEKDNLKKTRKMEPNEGHVWDKPGDAEGILWGGCVESLIVQCTTEKYLPKDSDLQGTILFLETSEGIPKPWVVKYLLTGFGERGWLNLFKAVVVGRPKAWEFDQQNNATEKEAYRKEQRETIVKTIREYNPYIPIIQNLDFGHTDPQVILPLGGKMRLEGNSQRIFVDY